MKVHNNDVNVLTLVMLLVLSAAWHTPLLAAADSRALRQSRPAVEVVFVLDTTGSMSGLIAAAKEKIWSIANTLAAADPAPVIRMGLVGYRDRGDAYVTTFTDLSDDLDAVYTRLMRFSADGGGDTPESVNQALYEAVNQSSWSTDTDTYRVVFLVGDAPPHMNYRNDVPYSQSCRLAAQKGIIINTVQCGDIAETTPVWRSIARLSEGEFFRVAQSGNAVLYETPYDAKIAELSQDLDDTRLYYGDAAQKAKMDERKQAADRIYSAASPSAVAKRTVFNSKEAGAKNFLGEQELVNDVSAGKVAPEELKKEELPVELQGLAPEQLKDHIASRIQARKSLQTQIDDLAHQRQAYIEAKVLETGSGAQTLDAQIYKCIQTQASKKGIRYTGGPAY
jgi:Mg-chelatase subunit ChlD